MNAADLTPYTRLLMVALLCPVFAFASTVYRTVDEHGAVYFSDTPPVGLIRVDTLEINTATPLQSEATEERLQAMRETTDRMVADRMARERHRSEIRKLGSEPDLNRAALASVPTEQDRYYSEPYSYRVYPPLRRPNHARPVPLPSNPGMQSRPVTHSPFSKIRRGYSPQVRDFFNH
ncbi:MAG: hypothetical protein ACI9NT_002093 [Bacteroidia bacterium]|jgi:hypothetical protein